MDDIDKMRAELAALMTFPIVAQVIRAIELREAIAKAEQGKDVDAALEWALQYGAGQG